MNDEEKVKKLAEELKRLTGKDEITFSMEWKPDEKMIEWLNQFPNHMDTRKHKMTDYDSKTVEENQ